MLIVWDISLENVHGHICYEEIGSVLSEYQGCDLTHASSVASVNSCFLVSSSHMHL